MGAQKLKHDALLMEWREKVADCRSSGKGVKEWCRIHQVSITTYYRWERELLLRTEQQLAIRASESSPPAFVEVRAAAEPAPGAEFKGGMAVAQLHTAAGALDVYRGADRETLQAIIEALKYAE